MTLKLKLEGATENGELKLSGKATGALSVSSGKEIYQEQVGGTYDYTQLVNLPTLDGEPLIGDVNEKDPTVPLWAKSSEKPVYSQEDIGIGAISLVDLDKLFNSL